QGSSLLVSQPRALPWATVGRAVGAPDSYAHTTFNRTPLDVFFTGRVDTGERSVSVAVFP
ncbi:MAG: hypothetical protein WCP06_12840, partial [Verrucomicrobiota bacterium]